MAESKPYFERRVLYDPLHPSAAKYANGELRARCPPDLVKHFKRILPQYGLFALSETKIADLALFQKIKIINFELQLLQKNNINTNDKDFIRKEYAKVNKIINKCILGKFKDTEPEEDRFLEDINNGRYNQWLERTMDTVRFIKNRDDGSGAKKKRRGRC